MNPLAKIKRWIKTVCDGVSVQWTTLINEATSLASWRANQRGSMSYDVIDVMVALILIGSMGVSAWNFGATNFSQADASVQVMVGTVVPMLAGVACIFILLKRRN